MRQKRTVAVPDASAMPKSRPEQDDGPVSASPKSEKYPAARSAVVGPAINAASAAVATARSGATRETGNTAEKAASESGRREK